jgi:hypothetical protein
MVKRKLLESSMKMILMTARAMRSEICGMKITEDEAFGDGRPRRATTGADEKQKSERPVK